MFTRKFTMWPLTIFVIILAVLACLLAIITALLPTVPKGVTLWGQSISGMKISPLEQRIVTWQQQWSEESILLRLQHDQTEQMVTLAQLGVHIEFNPILQELKDLKHGAWHHRWQRRWAMRHATLLPEVHIDEEKLSTTLAEVWPDIQKAKPVPAQRIITAADRVTYVKEQPVHRIHNSQLAALIRSDILSLNIALNQTAQPVIDVPLQLVYPEVTVETLVAQGVERKISQFTTHFRTSGSGRVHNIRSTAAVVHNLLLAPGDVFDYNKIVRETEKQFGFKQAPVIVNGKLVPGIGGGICQVSSTLYNAVLRSGLEVVERQNHSLAVRYVPLGQDATFASGYINFKFRNNLDSHLLIRVETTDSQISVKLFGSMPDGLSFDIQSKIVEVINPPVKYVQNPQLASGTTKVIAKGEKGYIVDTFRTTKQDGKTIQTEHISRDHYKAKPALIAANPRDIPKQTPQKNPTPRKQIIEDGVSGPIF